MYTALIRRILGVLLLVAAGLKVYGLGVDPVARSGVFSAPAVQFLVVAFEVFLGLWLLSARHPIGAWFSCLVAFVVFAGVSFHQGWIGQASCGCLGSRVPVNPWIMFGIDLAAVAILLVARPDMTSLRQTSGSALARTVLGAAGLCAGYLFLLGILAGFAHYRYGSIDAALASLRNERLSVHPPLVDMGQGVAGESRTATIDLANRTEKPIRLIGGTTDCSCTVVGDLPITIPPGETRCITVQVRLPQSRGTFNRTAEFVIDDQGFSKVGVRLTGRVEE